NFLLTRKLETGNPMWSSIALLLQPWWRTFFEERGQALLAFRRYAQAGDQCCIFDIDAFGGFDCRASSAQRQLLGFVLRHGATLRQMVQLAVDRFVQLVGGNALVQKSDTRGFGGIEDFGADEQPAR